MNVYVVAQEDYGGDGMGTATAGVFSTREKALEFARRLDPTLTEKQKSDLEEHGYATRPFDDDENEQEAFLWIWEHTLDA